MVAVYLRYAGYECFECALQTIAELRPLIRSQSGAGAERETIPAVKAERRRQRSDLTTLPMPNDSGHLDSSRL